MLCVYTFRPLSIPRPSPSDVSPNKLQNVKSRLNFHSIFQLASHQRGLSAQPTPNLLLTSIGFLIKKNWINCRIRSKSYILTKNNEDSVNISEPHQSSNSWKSCLEKATCAWVFSGSALIFPGLQDTRSLQWRHLAFPTIVTRGAGLGKKGCCPWFTWCQAVLWVKAQFGAKVLKFGGWPVLVVGKKGWAGTTLRKAKWPSQ